PERSPLEARPLAAVRPDARRDWCAPSREGIFWASTIPLKVPQESSVADGRNSSKKKSLTSEQLTRSIGNLGPAEAADALEELDPTVAAQVLQNINPSLVGDILPELEDDAREEMFAAAPAGVTAQWSLNLSFPEGS